MTFKSCLRSMRLRTLPLSLSGIIMGMSLAASAGRLEWLTSVALIITAALLQVLSNLSNELGDTLHGTDSAEDRQGMHYSIMDGEMTVAEMKRLIAVTAVLCCISGLVMVIASFKQLFAPLPIAFLALGAGAIWAAMHYTLGDNPYGYRGLGDIFVFIFFGLVSTLGAAYVCCHCFRPTWLLPACAAGLFSIGVLNVNNIRDMKSDAATRTTVAILLGARRARIYQTILITAGWVMLIAFMTIRGNGLISFLPVLTLPLFVLHLKGIWTREDRALDPMLPLLVMSTFATAILFAIAQA